MNVLIFSVNWYNRGDEAAIRAMVDEMRLLRFDLKIKFLVNHYGITSVPMENDGIISPYVVESRKKHPYNWIAQNILILTKGKLNLLSGGYRKRYGEILKAIEWADCAVYAPGGPCIGDIYRQYFLLLFMNIMRKNNVPYFFYAPSMGPFKKRRAAIREAVNGCDVLCVRESITEEYLLGLNIDKKINVTLDSAIQHDIDIEYYNSVYEKDNSLRAFLEGPEKTVGITVTDLQWNSIYRGTEIKRRIEKAFRSMVNYLTEKNYKIIFIPQLFGADNDYDYMRRFCNGNCYILSDSYDCYFQQYLISKLYAVIGLRYHSNVFSAKMGTPFLSISYEQKMKGFMEECGLSDYCIDVQNLSFPYMKAKFEKLESGYETYRDLLENIHNQLKKRSYKTTELLGQWLEGEYQNDQWV